MMEITSNYIGIISSAGIVISLIGCWILDFKVIKELKKEKAIGKIEMAVMAFPFSYFYLKDYAENSTDFEVLNLLKTYRKFAKFFLFSALVYGSSLIIKIMGLII